MNKATVVVVGSSNTDMIVRGEQLPRPGQTVLGGALQRAAGGKGANQAVAARRAGAITHFIAKVGNDAFGRESLIGFRREGIKLSGIRIEKGEPSGVALILLDSKGENLIAVAPGANMKLRREDLAASASAFRESAVALFQLEVPLSTVHFGVRLARNHGCNVVLNPAPAPPRRGSLAFLRLVDYLTPNASEAEAMTGIRVNGPRQAFRAAEKLLKMGPRCILLTLGEQGVIVIGKEGRMQVDALKVKVVDTVGAGDAFNGALACALAEDQPLERAVRFAVAAAGIAVTRQGAQPSMPLRREILQAMNKIP